MLAAHSSRGLGRGLGEVVLLLFVGQTSNNGYLSPTQKALCARHFQKADPLLFGSETQVPEENGMVQRPLGSSHKEKKPIHPQPLCSSRAVLLTLNGHLRSNKGGSLY